MNYAHWTNWTLATIEKERVQNSWSKCEKDKPTLYVAADWRFVWRKDDLNFEDP